MKHEIAIKRAYEPPSKADGCRVLVDRLWPRGLKREALAIDEWAKEVAPSTALRRRFHHDPERWEEFLAHYRAELDSPAGRLGLQRLRAKARAGKLTLVYAAKDGTHNNAAALRAILRSGLKRRTS
jgi:uncharacterized protein YeaO (DUF488 family)